MTTGSPGAITSSTYGTGPITIGQIATDRAGILINVATTLPNAIVFNTALGNDNPGIRLEANGIVLSGGITANSNAAFSGTGASATVSGAISGTGGLTSTNTGVLTLSGSNTYNGVTTINAGTLKFAKTASLYNGSTGSWTAANLNVKSGGTAAFNVGGTDEFSMADVTTLLTNLAASSSATNGMNAGSVLGFDTTNASGGTFTITDVIANSTGASGGSRGLIKSGSGTLALTGANTYTGNTTVSGGTLNLAGSSTGTLGAISVAGSGTTQLNIQAGSYTLGNVGLFVGNTAGNGTVNQSGGAVTWNNASLQLLIGNTTGAGTSGTYNLSGGSLTLFANGSGNRGVVLGVNPNTTATFNLSGTGTLVDNGVLQIGRSETGSSSANTTNLFTQTGGTATVANLTMGGTGLGTGITATLNLSGGTFSATSFTSNAAANTNTSVITIGGTAEVTLPVFPTVHGTGSTATITFDSTPGGGGFLAPTAASAAYMPAGSFTHAYLTTNGANFNVGSGKDVTVAQVLENNTGAVGTLTKTGAGVLTLSGANIYTGNTTVVSGTLIVSANSATTFADTATVSIASGAVLNLPNAVTDTVASLVINGSILPGGIYDASSPATSGFITGSGKIQIISAGYSSWAAANVGGALANVDTDLDGVQNGLEYFMNSAPGFTANPALVVSAGPVRTVTWSNGGNIPSTGYGTQFVVQTSPNLSTWTNVLSGDPNLSNTSGSVIFTLPTGAGEIFVRLVVTPN